MNDDGWRFGSVRPDYRRNAFDVMIAKGRLERAYSLPFGCFRGMKISSRNEVVRLDIDEALWGRAVKFTLADGRKSDFAVDFVLYHCEPSYDWSALNQIRRVLKGELRASRLSMRVVADALKTSPAQVQRLLTPDRGFKALSQLAAAAKLAGYRLDVRLTPARKIG